MASIVTARLKEVGVRLALGATPVRVLASVLANGAVTASLGIGVGLCALPLAVRFIRALVVGITPYDPLTLIVVPTIILISALLACVVPAMRAARVDVMHALRTE
jgi:ABC-type antimicrobial peptide transport system permease subunit